MKQFIGIIGGMLRIFLTIAVFVPATANSARTFYVIADLGTLGGSSSWGAGINNSGQATGWSYIAGDTACHGFLYSPETGMQDLGTLGGLFSSAYGTNDLGQTTGQSNTADGAPAFIYSAGTGMQDLGTLGGGSSSGYGINDCAEVTGYSYIAGDPVPHAFLYSEGAGVQDLGTLGGNYSYGIGINNSGQVTGISATTGKGGAHAFIYDAGEGMQDLGTLGGTGDSKGNAVNDSGQVTGVSSTSVEGAAHAFLYSAESGMQDLGTLGGSYSEGFAINNSGQVTGASFTSQNAATHAFLYSAGKMKDLNTFLTSSPGWTLTTGKGINDAGQIAGSGLINGHEHAFIMTRYGTPNAPTRVTATAGNALATVSFSAPASNGGFAITSYAVTSRPGGKTASGPCSPITVQGLTDGTAYTFTATATNSMGTGPASTSSNAITPATVPDAPAKVTAKAGNAQAKVSFKLPANGGSPITGCTVISKPGGLTATGAGSPIAVPGLTNGIAYAFTVKASNQIGYGPDSSYSNRVTPATVPGVPTEVAATAGRADATVSFTAPSSNGSRITLYTVTSSAGKKAKGRKSPITVHDLTDGISYTFTVTAANKIGAGPASSASNSVTPGR